MPVPSVPVGSVPVAGVNDRSLGWVRGQVARGRRFLLPAVEVLSRATQRLRNRDRDFRPIFVTGAIGSGTSLAASLLGQAFECGALINESARQIRRRSPLYVGPTDRYGTVVRYRSAIEPDASWTPELVRSELLRLYRSYADRPGDVVIDKGPNTNMTRAPLLARSFPTGRFVFVFRDPVANIEGFRRKWRNFGRAPLEESISFYREIHETFLAWVRDSGTDLHVIEYERFVEQPDVVLERLGAALDLRKATAFRKLEAKGSARGGRGIRSVEGGRVSILRGETESAVANMSASEIELIRGELRPLHERMREAAMRYDRRSGDS